jgi:hypothetical protein
MTVGEGLAEGCVAPGEPKTKPNGSSIFGALMSLRSTG